MRRTSIVLTLTVLLPACAARSATTQRVETLDAVEQLHTDLAQLFGAAEVEHAHWGISIYSLRTAQPLYRLNASRYMVPASNQKLLTSAVAAERLGWDYRFTTSVSATGPVSSDGLLNGDLVLTSNGDPTINPRHPERWHVFDDWAIALQARGIRSVSGRIIGNDNAFAEPGWGVGWAWDNLQYGYGAPVSALQYNENQIELLVGPGISPGADASISASPFASGLFVDHRVTTAPAGAETTVRIERVPGTALLEVRGQVAADDEPVTITAAVHNPTTLYVNAFREALARHGIFVWGGVLDIDDVRGPLRVAEATELVVDRSPPLSEIIDVTMKWSRNLYAETLLLALAPPGEPATGSRGLEVLQETLETWGIRPDAYLPRDGSGLSRYDFVSADALTRLLTYMSASSRHAELFRSTLPVGGVSGTLANRMKGTPAEGRIQAKTGSLSHVRALSGFVTTIAGEPLVFSILANNYRVATAEIDAIVDKALVRLVQFGR